MKRLLFGLVISVLVVSSASAQMLQGIVAGTKVSACTLYIDASSATDSNSTAISHDSTYDQAGHNSWSPASGTVSICKISVKLTKGAGDISGKTYVLKIYSMSGANLDSVLATSSGVTGSNSWDASYVDFTFSTPLSHTSGTGYSFALSSGDVDATNYASCFYYNNNLTGFGDQWSTEKVSKNLAPTHDLIMKIYTMQ